VKTHRHRFTLQIAERTLMCRIPGCRATIVLCSRCYMKPVRARDLCATCIEYERRTGQPRPFGLIRRRALRALV